MIEEQKPQLQKWPSILVGGLLIAVGAAACLFSGAYLLGRDKWDSSSALELSLFVYFAVHIGCGIGLALQRRWATTGAVALSVVALALLVFEPMAGLLLGGPIFVATGLLLSPLPVGIRYEPPLISRVSRRHLGVLGVFVAAMLLAFVGSDEIRATLWSLQVDRWESNCESTGNQEACGRYANHAVGDPDSFDEMRRGLTLYEQLCDQDVPRGCLHSGRVRSAARYEWYLGDESYLHTQRSKRSLKKCREGDARACVVLAMLTPKFSKGAVSARKLCETGEALGCFAWAMGARSESATRAACKAGFAQFCDPAARGGGCLEGDLSECGGESGGADAELLRAFAGLRDAKGGRVNLRTNPGLYGVSVSAEGLGQTCDAGSAAACFALGLNATADINPFEHGAVPRRALDVSWGRACELGANVACYAFAIRLLDRPFDEPRRDEKRAGELLQIACERSHVQSCWLAATELVTLPDGAATYRTAAEMACRDSSVEACTVWSHILAFDIDAAPWPLLDSEGFHAFRQACRDGNGHRACGDAADLVISGAATAPLWVQAASIAKFSCRGSWVWSCKKLFEAADRWQHLGMPSRSKLEDKICPQVPNACENGNEMACHAGNGAACNRYAWRRCKDDGICDARALDAAEKATALLPNDGRGAWDTYAYTLCKVGQPAEADAAYRESCKQGFEEDCSRTCETEER